jgi:streptogramin lyase
VGLSAGQTITLGSAPGAISVIPLGGLWISLPDRGAVVRVNPATGRSTSFAVGGRPTWIAAGSSGVWVANSAPASVVRLNARTGAQIASATLRASATALATSRTTGAAWVADGSGEISHIGLDGAVLGSPTSVTPAATGIGSGEGWVWATNGDTRGLIRVSPQGGSSARFDAGPGTTAVTFDQGVWTAHSNGHVTRFDPRPDRLQVNSDLPVAPELDGIAAVEQQPSVWAISKRTMTLYRISNTSQPAVTGTVAFSSAPTALAVGERSVWVATGDGKVTQILY